MTTEGSGRRGVRDPTTDSGTPRGAGRGPELLDYAAFDAGAHIGTYRIEFGNTTAAKCQLPELRARRLWAIVDTRRTTSACRETPSFRKMCLTCQRTVVCPRPVFSAMPRMV